MPKEIMRCKASDNPYLHKDFHGALSNGIEYLHRRYGADSVRQYLRQFAASFYGPLTEDLKEAVLDFWNYLSDNFLSNLKSLVEKNGIRGCYLYWSHTLNEEAADFTMELDEETGEFKIIMHRCPSKSRLMECKQIKPYPDYCGHCEVLYRRVLESLGYRCETDLSECDKARCRFIVRKK